MEYWAIHWEVSSKLELELAWPAVLRIDSGKLFVLHKMLIPEARMAQVVQEGQGPRLLHAGLVRMRLDLKMTFEFPPGFCKTPMAGCGLCEVSQEVKLPNQS